MKNGKFILLLLLLPGRLPAQNPGSLDPTFGAVGIVVENHGYSADECWVASGVPGNKMLLAGNTYQGNDTAFAVLRLLADGTPDSAFGIGGRAKLAFAGSIYAIAQQADGKILLAGYVRSNYPSGANDNFALVRLMPDGSRDQSFNVYALDDGQGLNNYATGILLPANDKIVLTGMTLYPDGRRAPTMLGLKSDGFIDNSFGDQGWVNGPAVETNFFNAHQISAALLPTGQILIATGKLDSITGDDNPWLLRYHAWGDPDTTFGNHGERLYPHSGDDAVYKVSMQSGNILLGGSTTSGSAGSDLLIGRLLPDGSPDSSFAAVGFWKGSLTPGIDLVFDVKNGPGSQIFAAVLAGGQPGQGSQAGVLRLNSAGDTNGFSPTTFGATGLVAARSVFFSNVQTVMLAGSAGDHFALARFLVDGAVDSTFGDNGALLIPYSGGNESWSDVAVLPDGRSLAAGTVFLNKSNHFALSRHLVDGQPDPSFGQNGLAAPDLFTGKEEAYALAVQPDGRIVVGGTAFSSAQTAIRFALARFTPDGKLDDDFNGTGYVAQFMGTGANAYCLSVALQPDGKILAGGYLEGGGFALMRFLPNGALDAGFGNGGKQETQFPDFYNPIIRKVLVASDGKILAVGYGYQNGSNKVHMLLSRYLSDGTPDTAFGNNGQIITDLNAPYGAIATSAVETPGGGLVAVGSAIVGNGSTWQVAVAQYLPNGAPDPAANPALLDVPGATFSLCYDVTPQPDGRLLLEGYSSGQAFLLRLNPNLDVDTTFGDGGFFRFGDPGRVTYGLAGAMQPDGKLLVGGLAGDAFQSDQLLFRLLTGASVGVIDAPATLASPLLYPNPVRNQQLTIEYELPAASPVQFELLDVQGCLLAPLLETDRPTGKNMENLRLPPGLAAGAYLIHIRTSRGSAAVHIQVR